MQLQKLLFMCTEWECLQLWKLLFVLWNLAHKSSLGSGWHAALDGFSDLGKTGCCWWQCLSLCSSYFHAGHHWQLRFASGPQKVWQLFLRWWASWHSHCLWGEKASRYPTQMQPLSSEHAPAGFQVPKPLVWQSQREDFFFPGKSWHCGVRG